MPSKKALTRLLTIAALSIASSLSATPTADGIYAVFATNKGSFTAELYYQQAPLSCANMVGLAEGTIPHFATGSTTPIYSNYYNSLKFHRVIDGFVIQGGDPLGTGAGGPGYSWPDEVRPELKHLAEGYLSMANSGANTNGSQFFVTLAATAHLNGIHNVFGKVVEGIESVRAIGKVATNANDAPISPVIINSLTILRIGEAANAFDPTFYANHFNPTIPNAGQATDTDTRAGPVNSSHVTVSTPFEPMTEYRILSSSTLENWSEVTRIQPSLDPNTTPEYQIALQPGSGPTFVKIDAKKRVLTDMSGIISEVRFVSGAENAPFSETIKITSNSEGTYSANGSVETSVNLKWMEISATRTQLLVSFTNGDYIQFYINRSNRNQGTLFLREYYLVFDPQAGRWVGNNAFAEGTFEMIPADD